MIFNSSSLKFLVFIQAKDWEAIINGLMQQRCNSIANALELHLFCIKPSICFQGDNYLGPVTCFSLQDILSQYLAQSWIHGSWVIKMFILLWYLAGSSAVICQDNCQIAGHKKTPKHQSPGSRLHKMFRWDILLKHPQGKMSWRNEAKTK